MAGLGGEGVSRVSAGCALTAGCAHWFRESSEPGDAVNSFIAAAAGTSDRVHVDLDFCASALRVAPLFFARQRERVHGSPAQFTPWIAVDVMIATFSKGRLSMTNSFETNQKCFQTKTSCCWVFFLTPELNDFTFGRKRHRKRSDTCLQPQQCEMRE